MMLRIRSSTTAVAALLLAACLVGSPAFAGAKGGRAEKAALQPAQAEEIRRAIDEHRLLDAGQIIDQAISAGVRDPRLNLFAGELGLARGRPEAALKDFAAAEAAPSTTADALLGKGVALARLGRTSESIAALEKAVSLTPDAWRGWNGLGSQYDRKKDWARAEDAYAKAMTTSGGAAFVYNNRGYSRLLQGRYDEAVGDFVAALERKPDLAEARTNLRLALAFKGEYTRSIASGPQEDPAALLNNAGFAAGVRGDYDKARDLLGQAIKSRSQYYERASENLKLVQSLDAQSKATGK